MRRETETTTMSLFSRYLQEIGEFPLLTPEQETNLGKKILAGRITTELLSRPETAIKEQALWAKVEIGHQAQKTLVACNLRLVVDIAKKLNRKTLSFPDLVQEGNLGLLTAAAKYDYRIGRFSTYATQWISSHITKAQNALVNGFSVGSHYPEEIIKFRTTLETGFSPDKMLGLARTEKIPLPYDLDLDNRTPDSADNTEEQALALLLAEQAISQLSRLDPRTKQAICLRFGIPDGKQHTQAEIGKRFGVTRQRADQIIAQGLKQIRAAFW